MNMTAQKTKPQATTHGVRKWTHPARLTGVGALAMSLSLSLFPAAHPALANLDRPEVGPGLAIGRDDDNQNNPLIQPPGTTANQSLNNTDVQLGGPGADVLIGLQGNDVQMGGAGDDILLGGTEQFQAPNSDVQFGELGDDVSVWAPGDGSDAFMGGLGRDAQVFGAIDKDANNVPTLTGTAPGYPQGIPTANVSGSPGFCTIEKVSDPNLGYQFLARFFVRSSGSLAVTLRLSEVEQVFCTNTEGGQITYADLTVDNPQFQNVTLDQVQYLNRTVRAIIR